MRFLETIHSFDVYLFLWVTHRKSQNFLVRCARLISLSADGYLYLIFCAFLLASPLPADRLLFKCLMLGGGIERAIYFVLKNLCRRDRPPQALNIQGIIIPADRFSFPSGHTSAAFLVATLIGFFFVGVAPLLLFWAVLVGMARVVLRVHFPTDTLIGALIGSSVGSATLSIVLP